MPLSYRSRFPLTGEPSHIALSVWMACNQWSRYHVR